MRFYHNAEDPEGVPGEDARDPHASVPVDAGHAPMAECDRRILFRSNDLTEKPARATYMDKPRKAWAADADWDPASTGWREGRSAVADRAAGGSHLLDEHLYLS
jgi:hypothetical protein